MKKKEKTVCQIIRFRGKIEAFLVSIDEFAISNYLTVSDVTEHAGVTELYLANAIISDKSK